MTFANAQERLRSPVGMCKVGTILLGIIILGVGLHSYSDSSWQKFGLHRYCSRPEVTKCPSISMERYYVSMIIGCFILSVVGIVITAVLPDFSKKATLKKVDLGYHAVAAGLLLVAAVVYIVSAAEINNLFPSQALRNALNLRHGEKLAAGILTLGNGILYAVIAVLIARSNVPDV